MADLQSQIVALRGQLAAITEKPARREPEEQTDYVKPGSDEHAAMLGLRKSTDEDGKFVLDGWALDDITNFPPHVPDEYLVRTLRGKVSELTAGPPKTQSVDPRKAHFAPVMWDPRSGREFRQITE